MSGFKQKAVSGFSWQLFGLLGQQGVQLAVRIIFAHLLLPAEYGVVIAAVVILDYATLVRVAGMANAFITYQGEDEEARHSVFWASFTSGILITALLFFGAGPIAGLLNAPMLEPILRVLSLTQLIDSFRIVPYALLMRSLRFRERAISETAPFLIGLGAALTSLLFLPPLWGLVIMYFTRSVAQAILFNVFEPYRPVLRLDRQFLRMITRRGLGFLSANLPSSVLDPLPLLFVTGRAGEAAGGFYSIGQTVASPAEKVSHSANMTLFPIFAKFAGDPAKLVESFLRSFRVVGLLSTAFLAWLIAVAPELIPLVFGERWATSVPIAQLLAVAAALRLYSYVAMTPVLAVNKTGYAIVTWTVTLGVAIALLALWPMPLGDPLPGATIAVIFTSVSFILALTLCSVAIGARFLSLIGAILPAFLSAGLALGAAHYAGEAVDVTAPLRLVIKTLVFVLVYAPVCGKLIGGRWTALMSPARIREVVKGH